MMEQLGANKKKEKLKSLICKSFRKKIYIYSTYLYTILHRGEN